MKHIRIWTTFCDAVSFFLSHIPLFFRAMLIPLALYLLAILFQFLPLAMEPTPTQLTFAGMANILQPFVVLWMSNICYRLALTGKPGQWWWSMAETWTVIAMILLAILIFIGAGLPAAVVYFGLTALGASIVVCSVSAGIVYGLILIYLVARLSLMFPGIAIRQKLDVEGTWNMTRENGLKIMVLMFLPVAIFGIAIGIVGGLTLMLAPAADYFMISLLFAEISSVLIFCVNGVALAYAYKQLKQLK